MDELADAYREPAAVCVPGFGLPDDEDVSRRCPVCEGPPWLLDWFWYEWFYGLCGSAGWGACCRRCAMPVTYLESMVA